MSDTDLEALARKVEAADPLMQGRLLEEAWEAAAAHSAEFRRFAVGPSRGFDNNAGKFAAALEALAFESAALMLIPADHTVQLSDWEDDRLREAGAWQAIVLPRGARGNMAQFTFTNRCDHAATPALALTAAALRARLTPPAQVAGREG